MFTLPPRQMFTLCFVIALILTLGTALLLASQPTMGGIWAPVPDRDNGLLLKNADHVLTHQERSEIIITAIENGDIRVNMHSELLLSDPDQFTTFAAYNRFMSEQKRLSAILHGKEVTLIPENGPPFSVPLLPSRSIFALPGTFWIYSAVGMLCFLISAGVWCYRRADVTSRLLALSGFGFFCSLLCLSIYGLRELGLAPGIFMVFSALNHLFMLLFCYALLLLFCYYPCQLGNRTLIILISVGAVLIWFNQTWQWIEPPLHAFYLPNHIIPYAAAIVLGITQWRLTRREPVKRAVLRWFILSIWISIGGAGAMFIIPSLYGRYEVIPLWITAFGVLAMFVFFALGTLRCGLFGLEKWWFTGWAWMLTGTIVILADLFIIMLLNVNLPHLLPASLLLLGWLYFPARYWFWNLLERRGRNRIEDTLPQLLQTLFSSGNQQDIIDKWPDMLKSIFQPLELTPMPQPITAIGVRDNGLTLDVPGVAGENGWRLKANHSGSKLFGPEEQKLAAMVHDLARTILHITTRILEARQKGTDMERERIMRDLHDDVLPKLITLKHRSTSPLTETADAAFQSLRDCIYLLRNKVERPVSDVLADWRAEVAARLEPLAITLHWSQPPHTDNPVMTPLQQINGNRILQEAISNVIKHAGAHTVRVILTTTDCLTVCIEDDGNGIPGLELHSWHKVGTGNMLVRAREMGGTVQWRNLGSNADSSPAAGFAVFFSFPLTPPPEPLFHPRESHA